MTDMIAHRGPDDGGVWVDREAGIALGHRRLAILDVSHAGHQPMLSACGRFVFAFNGEIYNHADLRQQLAAECRPIQWRGRSDTETFLEAIAHWGVEDALKRAMGMFAFALWDRREGRLTLGRDRMGEKPLYYGWAGGSFIFASELKALTVHPEFLRRISTEALTQYMRFSYVPAPWSIWSGTYKLQPGCLLTLEGSAPTNPPDRPILPGERHGTVSIARYWSFADTLERGACDQIGDELVATRELEEILSGAVGRQMVSDVPLGLFLSGGVDSSLIAALMQSHATAPVRTFTIGFAESEFDESRHARAVAQHLGTDHTEIQVSAGDALAVIPKLPDLFDEPFADASQIPTYLVSKAARAFVKVVLTGDAGDELFGGYTRYQRVPEVWRYFRAVPFELRRAIGRYIESLPLSLLNSLAVIRDRLLATGGSPKAGDRILRVARRLSYVRNIDDLYLDLMSAWDQPDLVVAAEEGYSPAHEEVSEYRGVKDPAASMMYRDAITYLPDDILCKVDRSAMGVGLETRAPLIDPAVIAFCARLPMAMKIRAGQGKWALRQVLYRHVPQTLIDRPKTGFYLPVGQWLRGPLRDWAENLLAEQRLSDGGVLRPGPIRTIWAEHVAGDRDWTSRLWTVLMFQSWFLHR